MIRPKFGWRSFTDQVAKRFVTDDKDTLEQFNEWEIALHNRLEIGAQEYGDSSYKREYMDLLEELLQENLDRAGWAYIMWVKANAELSGGGLPAKKIMCLQHICEMALSTAHRAFGAFQQDASSFAISSTVCDLNVIEDS